MSELENKKIVLIGGGTGNAVLLRSLKKYTENISVIVSVGDDGGSSGKLRREMGIIPPGDIRNCLVAMADEENTMAMVMNKRFQSGFMNKQSLGNIILAALFDMTGSFPKAIRLISDVLAIKGKVFPVTVENITLCAEFENGKKAKGESRLAAYALRHRTAIKKIDLIPENPPLWEECRKAIREADVIIYSPGSLYTSLIPNLLVKDMCSELAAAKARKIYLPNIMTEHGETDGFCISDLLDKIEAHSDGRKIIDTVIYSVSEIPENVKKAYAKEKAEIIQNRTAERHKEKYKFIGADIALISNNTVRHNADKIWEILKEEI